MKKSNWLLLTTILVITSAMLWFTFSFKTEVDSMGDDITAINEVFNQYVVAVNTGDFDLWISLWTDDAVQMPPDTPARVGKEQIREAMKPGFDQMNLDMTINSIDDVKVYGDLGIVRCTYTLKMTPKAGGETINAVPDAKDLSLWERRSDGSWKLIYDCNNSNVPLKQE